MDWLTIWGVTQAVGFVFKPILEDLAKESVRDYAKDFFKDCLSKVIRLPEKDPLKEAYGKALKEFLALIQGELEDADYQEIQIKQYTQPLQAFIKQEAIAATLGSAFDEDRKGLDTKILAQTWKDMNLPSPPKDFNWELISKRYFRKVEAIIQESDKLRPIFAAQSQVTAAKQLEAIAGISPNFDLGQYSEGLREQYGNLQLESLNVDGVSYNQLRLWQMFVPQEVRECQEFLPQVFERPKEYLRKLQDGKALAGVEVSKVGLERYSRNYFEQTPRPVLEVLGDPNARHTTLEASLPKYIVILGDPGSGKSSLLKYIANAWAKRPLPELPIYPLPLLVELRTYNRDKQNGKCQDFLTFLHAGSITCHLNQQQLHEKLQAGHAIALFDGLDEVFDPVQREDVITDIHRFTNVYKQVQVIVTSRPTGYKAQRLRDAEFSHFMLQDLNETQIKEFLQRWHDLTFQDQAEKRRKQERLQKAIDESNAIRELAGNPLLLTMMAILNRNRELPRDRPELYNQASQVLLYQWDVERQLVDKRFDPKLIDYRDKQSILRKVAYRMQASKTGLAGNIISVTELENTLTEHLTTMSLDQPRLIARLMIDQLRKRNFILCHLGADSLGEESYGFVHRTFLEYFCASEIIDRFEKQQILSFEQLRDEIFGKHWKDENWHEVLKLICNMLNDKFTIQLVDFLIGQTVDRSQYLEVENENKVCFSLKGLSHLLLASDCLSDVNNAILTASTREALLSRLKAEINLSDIPLSYQFAHECLKQVVQHSKSLNLETVEYLKKLITESHQEDVRRAAVDAIGRYFKEEPANLEYLQQLVA